MRTPEDSSKLSQQVPREQKFRAMLDRTVIVGAGIQGAWYRLHEIAAHLEGHYATVSRQLK